MYVLIDSTGKQRFFHVKAVADLFRSLYGGEVQQMMIACT